MNHNGFLKIFIFIVPFWSSCTTLGVKKIASLPKNIKESSGLIVESDSLFWTHNDSGDEPLLYQFNPKGQLLRSVKIEGAINHDWEEIALDTEGVLYIGDFGNNSQNRRNLVIYKFLNFKNKYQLKILSPDEIIEFSYEDQINFPPHDSLKHFDAEAMLIQKDSILIFTKDFYTKPYTGKTRIYSLPNKAGKYIATLKYILNTHASKKYKGAITAASQTSKGAVVLMAYRKIIVFTDFGTKSFWEGQRRDFNFSIFDMAQREAIAFYPDSDCLFYITSEKIKFLGGNFSTVNICFSNKKVP